MNIAFMTAATVAITAGSAMAGAGFLGQELTINGGFETGDTSSWEYFPSTNDTFGVSMDANSGSFSGNLNNMAEAANPVIKQANIGVGQVEAGEMVSISFAAKGNLGPSGVIFAEFFSELSGGGTSGAILLGNAPVAITGDWQTFSYSVMAGPDVSGGVTLQFGAITGAVGGAFAEVFIDDVSVSIVPAPAGLAAFGLAGLAGIRRRR